MVLVVYYIPIVFFILIDANEDVCNLEGNGNNSRCMDIWDCNTLKEKEDPKRCSSYKNNDLKVCCPISVQETHKNIGDYAKNACTKLKYWIILNYWLGAVGPIAEPQEFKYMALLGYNDNGAIVWACGGSLISKQYVLTAAHCLNDSDYGPVKYVRLGELNYTTKDDKTEVQNFSIVKTFKHLSYNGLTYQNDIALLKLDRAATFNKFVRPICLNTEKDFNTSKANFLVAGWGETGNGNNKGSSHLRKAKVQILSKDYCSEINENIQICAGSLTEKNNTCKGDSGGPLVLRREGPEYLTSVVGVTSYGPSCGFEGNPSVYTRVSSYIEWIENIVWKGKE